MQFESEALQKGLLEDHIKRGGTEGDKFCVNSLLKLWLGKVWGGHVHRGLILLGIQRSVFDALIARM